MSENYRIDEDPLQEEHSHSVRESPLKDTNTLNKVKSSKKAKKAVVKPAEEEVKAPAVIIKEVVASNSETPDWNVVETRQRK